MVEGNAGNDTIAGGGGDDYTVFNGNYADYSITGSYASGYQVVDMRPPTATTVQTPCRASSFPSSLT